MSATARDYQTPEPANTEGLDDLFEVLPTSADSVATDADSAKSVATGADTERLWNLLKEKDAKIEALLMRNGYLQSQVETSQEAIKLLTDSQHKRGWWAKFSSWFFKAQ